MAETYDHDIPAWMDGTESLSDGEYRAYHVICQLIYLQNGPILANEKGIAGRCNQHILAFRNNLSKLIEKHKLIIADGKITNRRAAIELSQALKRRTPRQPPSNPPATSAQPPPGSPRKPLKIHNTTSNGATRTGGTGGKGGSSSSLSLFGDSLTQGVSEMEISSLASGWNFDEFWQQYPHKVGKRAAIKAFDAAKKRKSSFVDLMLGLSRYAAKRDDRPWCNPSTWLNQDRWLDEPAVNARKRRDETIDEQTARLVERAQQLENEKRAEREGRTF